MSVPQNILQRAFSLVTPFTPSIVEPVHALIKSLPACERAFTVVNVDCCVIAEEPVRPVTEAHNAS